jgi:lipoate-protein ligase A
MNMAADQALLETAAQGVASVRFYRWEEATLSLGYFQKSALRLEDENLARLPFVRRPTGGDTLIHHRELTYALALPAGPPFQPASGAGSLWLDRMHAIIAAALLRLGVATCPAPVQKASAFAGFLCFQHRTAGDLLIGHDKVVGSAQRRQRGALLQHGAILLGASPHTPMLPGIRELAGPALDHHVLEAAICSELARQTGWQLIEDEWTQEEKKRMHELAATRYSDPGWNEKR